ncbi:MAG: hypothetical protein ACLQME_16805 [Alphaproteobacteria bacterium]
MRLKRAKLSRPVEHATGFDNQRGTAEQWLKEDKNALQWTRLACCSSPPRSPRTLRT